MKALYILIFIALMPALGYAQKAYETVIYRGSVQNIRVNFSLANGYPVGSYAVLLNYKVHKKQTFMAAADININGVLRLNKQADGSKNTDDYLIINGIQPSFTTPPGKLKAKYYTGGKGYSFFLNK